MKKMPILITAAALSLVAVFMAIGGHFLQTNVGPGTRRNQTVRTPDELCAMLDRFLTVTPTAGDEASSTRYRSMTMTCDTVSKTARSYVVEGVSTEAETVQVSHLTVYMTGQARVYHLTGELTETGKTGSEDVRGYAQYDMEIYIEDHRDTALVKIDSLSRYAFREKNGEIMEAHESTVKDSYVGRWIRVPYAVAAELLTGTDMQHESNLQTIRTHIEHDEEFTCKNYEYTWDQKTGDPGMDQYSRTTLSFDLINPRQPYICLTELDKQSSNRGDGLLQSRESSERTDRIGFYNIGNTRITKQETASFEISSYEELQDLWT